MILLITTANAGGQCGEALLAATKQKVHISSDYRHAQEFLRTQEVSALVFDESTLTANCREGLDVIKHGGAAVVVEVNFGIQAQARVIREVQQALRRSQQQRIVSQKAARAEMASEFTGELTGIMMASQMALYVPSLPERAQAKIQEVYEIAERLRDRLKSSA